MNEIYILKTIVSSECMDLFYEYNIEPEQGSLIISLTVDYNRAPTNIFNKEILTHTIHQLSSRIGFENIIKICIKIQEEILRVKEYKKIKGYWKPLELYN